MYLNFRSDLCSPKNWKALCNYWIGDSMKTVISKGLNQEGVRRIKMVFSGYPSIAETVYFHAMQCFCNKSKSFLQETGAGEVGRTQAVQFPSLPASKSSRSGHLLGSQGHVEKSFAVYTRHPVFLLGLPSRRTNETLALSAFKCRPVW